MPQETSPESDDRLTAEEAQMVLAAITQIEREEADQPETD